jgi:hypothetical protein
MTDETNEIAEDYQSKGAKAPSGRTTRAQDPKLRAAIERRSLDAALEYYDSIGGTNPRELGKPYDIAITVGGVERHCEVKGSSMIIDTVELTINEVNHGNDCGNVDLIVVDGIEVLRDKDTGDIHAHGGRRRVWTDWSPADDALRRQKFAYTQYSLVSRVPHARRVAVRPWRQSGPLSMTGQATADDLRTRKAVAHSHQVGDPSTAYRRPPGTPAFEAVFVVTV